MCGEHRLAGLGRRTGALPARVCREFWKITVESDDISQTSSESLLRPPSSRRDVRARRRGRDRPGCRTGRCASSAPLEPPADPRATTSSSPVTTCRCSTACPRHVRPDLRRSAVQHRPRADPALGDRHRRQRRVAGGLRRPPLPHRAAAEPQLRRRLRGLPRASSSRDWPARGSCWPLTGRCTSTSTTARPTTASSCSTSCSGATRSSTRSSGPTTTAPSRAAAGRPSTTRSWPTCAPPAPTTSTPTRWSASPTWRPGLVGAEKAARGKRPTDVWFHTIVPTNGAEKTGYPTQKPAGRAAAAGGGVVAARGMVPGSVRGVGHRRRGVRASSGVATSSSTPARSAIDVMRARLGEPSAPARARAART